MLVCHRNRQIGCSLPTKRKTAPLDPSEYERLVQPVVDYAIYILDLEGRVASWWLPDDVVFIDEVPKTSVGKFSKKDLRAQFQEHQWSGI